MGGGDGPFSGGGGFQLHKVYNTTNYAHSRIPISGDCYFNFLLIKAKTARLPFPSQIL